MKKIFLLTTFIMTFFVATAFAAEESATVEENPTVENAAEKSVNGEITVERYEYTSETFGYKIVCPTKPIVVVDHLEGNDVHSETLIFANDGAHINYGYVVKLNAFKNDSVPNFNRDNRKVIEDYMYKLKKSYQSPKTELVSITKKNKGVLVILPPEIDVLDENGVVEGTLTPENESEIIFFRSEQGTPVSIQLLCDEVDEKLHNMYIYSIVSFKDAPKANKKKK